MKLVDCDDNDYNDDDSYVLDEAAERRYKVVFHLFGSTQSDIDQVIREIDELGKEAVSDRVLDSVDDQAHIAKLTRDQVLHYSSSLFCLPAPSVRCSHTRPTQPPTLSGMGNE